jgi:hypothetical protein
MGGKTPDDRPNGAEEKDLWDRIADVLEPIADAVDPPPKVEDERE